MCHHLSPIATNAFMTDEKNNTIFWRFLKVFQPTDWAKANRLMRSFATEAKAATGDKREDYWTKFWEIKNEQKCHKFD